MKREKENFQMRINFAKNTGAAYADAIAYAESGEICAAKLRITVSKEGKIISELEKGVKGRNTYIRIPVCTQGRLVINAYLMDDSSNVLASASREIYNFADYADTCDISLEQGSRFDKSMRIGLEYILGIDVARLLQPSYEMHGLDLRYEKGIDTGAKNSCVGARVERYGGWEVKGYSWGSERKNPDTLTLAGEHMGHWLSAAAAFCRLLSGSGDADDRQKYKVLIGRMNYLLDKLDRLQTTKIPQGCTTASSMEYIGGCPENTFLKCYAMDTSWAEGYWVPWYGVHKIYQGLIDVYDYAPEDTAMKSFAVLERFAGWALAGIRGMSDSFMQEMLNIEYGGMNEIFARIGRITGSEEYELAGRRFTHDRVLQPMVCGRDELGGQHANTIIPKVIGAAQLYEQNPLRYDGYKKAAEYFWDTVVGRRSYAIGGNSISEHFECGTHSETLGIKTCESCNTYNMMRLTEFLFRWEHKTGYMDWYEKALYNHILAQQEENGAKMYFVSLMQGHHRIYEKKYEAWWCCSGTGMENPARYTRVAYFEDNKNNVLYVNLYLPGRYEWKNSGLIFEIKTSYPYSEKVTIRVSGSGCGDIKFRAPSWTRNMLVRNGGETVVSKFGNEYIRLSGVKCGDEIELLIPMSVHVYTPRTKDRVVFEYGPVVLAAALGRVPPEMEYTHNETILSADCVEVPYITGGDAVAEPVDKSKLLFRINAADSSDGKDIILKPFFDIIHEYYCVYFDINGSKDDYEKRLNGISIDRVEPDGQQDELGHGLVQNMAAKEQDGGYYYHSVRGSFSIDGKTYVYREAGGESGAFFKYNMRVCSDSVNYLFVRYRCGVNSCDFRVYANGAEIAHQAFFDEITDTVRDVYYEIPKRLTVGKRMIAVKFAPIEGSCTAGVIELRTTSARLDR